ncbi:hypothetical protein BC962_3169 [Gillisia mitskevichiae]|uniref:Outer membrane protein with beta-barrel domain n=1 Tax=Gillisia mitskevichiae TaxID=270921 RepID=A0A495NW80_9FLAO|nr:hypothetical protein [Gillisia mitskevichiae]RKS42711.1 hypothetical protein BC962_3169 [Gillisia mitskevichiae]
MKKLVISFFVLFMGITSAFSQGDFRFGVNGGIPVGDVEDFSNFHLGTDVAYMFNVAEVLDVGPLLGYSHYFVEDDFDDIQFIPVAASGRFGLSSFYLGADLGYAIGVDDGNDGGFYYRPMLGYRIGKLGIAASYEGISMDGGSINSINLGIEFGL